MPVLVKRMIEQHCQKIVPFHLYRPGWPQHFWHPYRWNHEFQTRMGFSPGLIQTAFHSSNKPDIYTFCKTECHAYCKGCQISLPSDKDWDSSVDGRVPYWTFGTRLCSFYNNNSLHNEDTDFDLLRTNTLSTSLFFCHLKSGFALEVYYDADASKTVLSF